jgi:hypothetical protein
LVPGEINNGDRIEDECPHQGNIFQNFPLKGGISEPGNDRKFQDSKTGIIEEIREVEMKAVKNKPQEITLCHAGEAAIKKYYPKAFTPVPLQEEEVKDNG